MSSRLLQIILLSLVVISIPLTVFVVQRQQEIRQRAQIASEPTPSEPTATPSGNLISSPSPTVFGTPTASATPTVFVTLIQTPVPPSPTPTSTPIPTPTPTPNLVLIQADMDRDGCVGILDFNVWYQAAKTSVVRSGTFPDANKDGDIDLLDFNLWFRGMIKLPKEKLC